MRPHTVYVEGCARCQLFLEIESGYGERPAAEPGDGTDCKGHRCSRCEAAAPEEGHGMDGHGAPLCAGCEAAQGNIPGEAP